MKTFHVLTFGCQMNYADSARIKAVLLNCGFLYSEDIKKADIVIFDTCSVKQKAEDKITGKLKEISKKQKVRITGCMVQHNLRSKKLRVKSGTLIQGNFLGSVTSKTPEVIGLTNQEIEKKSKSVSGDKTVYINHAFNPLFHNLQKKRLNIELFWRIDDTGFLPLILKRLGYQVAYDKELINEYEYIVPVGMNTSMNSHKTTAYIPISTGCNQFCAYCIVPYARGLEKYFSVEKIIEEAKMHLKNGAQEIVLLGQIVNKHPQFVEIVKKILKLKGLKRLRYTSPYPTYYSQELIALHQTSSKLCPHIHMPLQSGSDAVLKKMFRGYTVKDAKSLIDSMCAGKRNISLTTDIIVGFPDESEKDFQKSLQLVKYGKFDMVYIGIYSPRPGTLGAKKYTDNISREVKWERWNRLNTLLTQISRENNEREIGTVHTVLINEIQDGQWIGVTDTMKQVTVQYKKTKSLPFHTGDFVRVVIAQSNAFHLFGTIVDEN